MMAVGEGFARHHQIHGVQPVLPVPDVVAAAEWWRDVLGFDIDFYSGEPPDHARVKTGHQRQWGDAVYVHLSLDTGPIVPCGETRLHVGHDIDAMHRAVLAAGATVLMPPTNQPWQLREIKLQAPGGHRLVLGAEIPA